MPKMLGVMLFFLFLLFLLLLLFVCVCVGVLLGGGFIFFVFTSTWGRFPFWLIFFKGVETTNQFSVLVFVVLVSWSRCRNQWCWDCSQSSSSTPLPSRMRARKQSIRPYLVIVMFAAIDPWKLTLNLKVTCLKRKIIFHPPPFFVQNVHVSGCMILWVLPWSIYSHHCEGMIFNPLPTNHYWETCGKS